MQNVNFFFIIIKMLLKMYNIYIFKSAANMGPWETQKKKKIESTKNIYLFDSIVFFFFICSDKQTKGI